MELVIASQNSQKVFEIRKILAEEAPNLNPRSLHDFPDYVPETTLCNTLLESAIQKAQLAASGLKAVSLSDQYGLVIPALGGEVQAMVNKASKPQEAQHLCVRRILEQMKPFSGLDRAAYLICCLAIAAPDGRIKNATARIEGVIADAEVGKADGIFDSIFIKHDYGKTLAQLPQSVQKRVSVRLKAFQKLLSSGIDQFFVS